LLRLEGAGHAPFLSHVESFADAVCSVASATRAHPGAAEAV